MLNDVVRSMLGTDPGLVFFLVLVAEDIGTVMSKGPAVQFQSPCDSSIDAE